MTQNLSKEQWTELLAVCRGSTRSGSFAHCDVRFAGAKSVDVVNAFIARIQIYKEMENIEDADALKGFALLLTDTASIWWNGIQRTIGSWEDAIAALRKAFAPRKEPNQIYAAVFATKQKSGQLTEEFVMEKRALLAQLPSGRHNEETLLDMVYCLLHLSIRTRVPREEISSFSELTSRARQLEELQAERAESTKEIFKKCRLCRRKGHTIEECRFKEKKRNFNPIQEKEKTTTETQVAEPTTSRGKLVCYGCGEEGHFRNKCPRRVKVEETPAVNFYSFHAMQHFTAVVPTIIVKINGIQGIAHLDTAARTSVVGATLYEHLQKNRVQFTQESADIVLADGSAKTATVLETLVNIDLQGRSLPIKMVVLPDAKDNRTLLGIDFLEEAGIILNLPQRAWSFVDTPDERHLFLDTDPGLSPRKPMKSKEGEQRIQSPNSEEVSPFLSLYASPIPDVDDSLVLTKVDTPEKAYEMFPTMEGYSPGAIHQIFKDALPFNVSPPKDPRLTKRRKLTFNSCEFRMPTMNKKEDWKPPEKEKELVDLIHKFPTVFADHGPPTPYTVHRIETAEKGPVACPPYRVSPAKLPILKTKIEEMLDAGIIEESETPWTFPVVLVPKKNGEERVCVDFRKLNEITTPDPYPLPRIDDLLHAARCLKYMSTLDLQSGYWQIAIAPEHRDKAGLITPFGLYRFIRMPFGLRNAPATFQRLMDHFKAGLPDVNVLIYLDDIIVRSETYQGHLEDLEKVFGHLRKYHLRVNRKKCRFCCTEIKYLGHIITPEGIGTDPEKVAAIIERPAPTNVKQVLSFVQTCSWYRRFVPDFSKIAKPLTDLTRKQVAWKWSDKEQAAFDELKGLMTTAPVLKQVDIDQPFVIKTDASQYALGALLAQGNRENEHPIEYAGRLLTKAELNYSTTEKEALAIIYAIGKFRGYIEGAPAVVITDHQPLTWLMNLKTPTGRLARWALQLQQYNLKVQYSPGRTNTVADFLSRPPCSNVDKNCEICHVQVDFPTRSQREVRERQMEDAELSIIIGDIESQNLERGHKWFQRGYLLSQGILYRCSTEQEGDDARLVVPRSEQEAVLVAYHDAPTSGHYGVDKTLERIAKRYHWQGMRASVTKHLADCVKCQRYKIANRRPAGLLQTTVGNQRFEVIAIDLFGPLPSTKDGKRWIFIVEDILSRWVELFALTEATAENCTKVLLNEVLMRYGMPRRIISDNGTQFISTIMQQLTYCLGIKQSLTPLYHAEANPVERRNRDLKTQLGILVGSEHDSWAEHLAVIRFAMNTAACTATGYTPAYLTFARELRTPQDTLEAFQSIMMSENVTTELTPYLQGIEKILIRAKETTEKRQDQNRADSSRRLSPSYMPGDLVWVETHPLSNALKGVTAKFAPRRDGPYRIVASHGPTSYTVAESADETKTLGVYHTSALTPYRGPEGEVPEPQQPLRRRGRPRKNPPKEKNKSVRGPGRPRKRPTEVTIAGNLPLSYTGIVSSRAQRARPRGNKGEDVARIKFESPPVSAAVAGKAPPRSGGRGNPI